MTAIDVTRLTKVLELHRELAREADIDVVLRRIAGEATAILGAERGTLFIVDAARHELWSRVLVNTKLSEIRLPLDGTSLAAAVAKDGLPLRIADAYGDPRFDPVAVTEHCLGAEPGEVVAWLQRWVYDLLSLKLAGRLRYHVTDQEGVRAVAARCDPSRAATLLRKLAKARSLAQHPLNPRLFFEDLLIQYQALIVGGNR